MAGDCIKMFPNEDKEQEEVEETETETETEKKTVSKRERIVHVQCSWCLEFSYQRRKNEKKDRQTPNEKKATKKKPFFDH